MKRKIIVAFILILFTLTIVGCGVPVEQYETLRNENSTLLTERGELIAGRDILLAEHDVMATETGLLVAENEALNEALAIVKIENEALEAKSEDLSTEKVALIAERAVLEAENKTLKAEARVLKAELLDIQQTPPLRGFSTLTEFKAWIAAHVQPETTYISDSFLAACQVQSDALADGYLMGFDVDELDGDEWSIVLTTFVGNQLYWWFAEDEELWGSMGEWFRR